MNSSAQMKGLPTHELALEFEHVVPATPLKGVSWLKPYQYHFLGSTGLCGPFCEWFQQFILTIVLRTIQRPNKQDSPRMPSL